MHEVLERVAKAAPLLAAEACESDELGWLTDVAAKTLRDTGLVRLLQPKEHAGYESHPNDFLEAVMAVGVAMPSAGWIAGVVGVHPWEIAMMDPKLQDEIWGDDPDTWTASPYAPMGRAMPVDGGFLFTGQWPYSTGTDFCDWVILGGMVVGDGGQPVMPPDIRHFVLPRPDYEIVEGSWRVMGLQGTGSKDVRMTDVFVPGYRVVEASKMMSGFYETRQPGKPLYTLGFGVMFSAAIGAGTLGIAQGALHAYRDVLDQRVSVTGAVSRTDPHHLSAYGAAASDVAASVAHFLSEMAGLYDHACAGGDLTLTQRLQFRRDQVRAARRATDAVDRLFNLAGASARNADSPLQRYWRDLHTAEGHVCNVAEMIYDAWATNDLGGEVPPNGLW